MVTPAKHPHAANRKREGANKSLVQLETKLKPLQTNFPEDHFRNFDYIDVARRIWEDEIIPLIHAGILKRPDKGAVTSYVELASLPVTSLSGAKCTYLSKLRDQLGLNPKARLNLTNGQPTSAKSSLADVMSKRAPSSGASVDEA